ncbi:hypothetical protein L1987_70399 [Smallanthus sonchifolius]|uniref:Uncharacterized protein n=1 Tax=Smallanthus sonchifolius TaxID=185202 RepID=A0ACB9ATU5_9ASTR|nr:hypothetical protein L1987_70399 [Smallanthus sonchifolius]
MLSFFSPVLLPLLTVSPIPTSTSPMSSNRGGGQSNKGKNVAGVSKSDVNRLNEAVQDVNLNSGQDGGWEVISKKNKNRPGNGAGAANKQWGSQTPKPNAWGQPVGARGSGASGWNWNSRPGNPWQSGNTVPNPQPFGVEEHVEDDNENEEIDESDDELLSDEYDSDEIPKSHEERKKNPCGIALLVRMVLVLLTGIAYKGATVNPAGESYGQWMGLNEVVKDKEIVWPPMVVIMNTQLEQDESDKWVGMGNQELLDYFGSYEAVRARHSYGPRGHKGKSKLKFEMVSYQEKVVNQLKQMNEDNQQLHLYKNKVVKEQKHSKALEESYGLVSQKLRETEKQNRNVRERTQQYHEQNKEEMDYQEQFFKDQLKVIQDARNAKEGHFDKLQQEERMTLDPQKSYWHMTFAFFIKKMPLLLDLKLEEMKEFEEEREKLVKKYEEKIAEMKNRYWKEQLEIEEGFNAELNQLMNHYTPEP